MAWEGDHYGGNPEHASAIHRLAANSKWKPRGRIPGAGGQGAEMSRFLSSCSPLARLPLLRPWPCLRARDALDGMGCLLCRSAGPALVPSPVGPGLIPPAPGGLAPPGREALMPLMRSADRIPTQLTLGGVPVSTRPALLAQRLHQDTLWGFKRALVTAWVTGGSFAVPAPPPFPVSRCHSPALDASVWH